MRASRAVEGRRRRRDTAARTARLDPSSRQPRRSPHDRRRRRRRRLGLRSSRRRPRPRGTGRRCTSGEEPDGVFDETPTARRAVAVAEALSLEEGGDQEADREESPEHGRSDDDDAPERGLHLTTALGGVGHVRSTRSLTHLRPSRARACAADSSGPGGSRDPSDSRSPAAERCEGGTEPNPAPTIRRLIGRFQPQREPRRLTCRVCDRARARADRCPARRAAEAGRRRNWLVGSQ